MTGYEIQGIDEGLSFERDGIREKDVGGHMRAGRGYGVSKRERSRHV